MSQKCKGKTKKGQDCKLTVRKGFYCHLHLNQSNEKQIDQIEIKKGDCSICFEQTDIHFICETCKNTICKTCLHSMAENGHECCPTCRVKLPENLIQILPKKKIENPEDRDDLQFDMLPPEIQMDIILSLGIRSGGLFETIQNNLNQIY